MLLRHLASQELPVEIAGREDIDRVRVLVDAGLVKAVIPAPIRTYDRDEQLPANVTEITRMGRQMLRRFVAR